MAIPTTLNADRAKKRGHGHLHNRHTTASGGSRQQGDGTHCTPVPMVTSLVASRCKNLLLVSTLASEATGLLSCAKVASGCRATSRVSRAPRTARRFASPMGDAIAGLVAASAAPTKKD